MSLHSSLRVDTAGAQQRTVLTRLERIKDLMKKDLWKEGQNVVALPKTKILKVKAKKTKVKKEEETAASGPAKK
ncbi:MAG TPA: small basic protein [Candidatus Omnitrophota bacterium]|nr:small basic protein [Candidatus Omnitrophota bacterium]HPN56716.1 small basic protein [Candidatus Omnitrophota bacterium]